MRTICISLATCIALIVAGCGTREGRELLSTPASDDSWATSDLQIHEEAQGGTIVRRVLCYFRNPDSTHPVYAGTVTINGTTIPAKYLGHGTTYSMISDGGSVPLALNGSWHRFEVAGAAGFPPFIDSIRAPVGTTAIASPAEGDTVSRSSGLRLSWNASTTGGVSVVITDTSRSVGSKYIDTTMAVDPGSVTIPATRLAPLHAGPLTVVVTRGNVTHGMASEHFRYRLAIGSSASVTLHLIP